MIVSRPDVWMILIWIISGKFQLNSLDTITDKWISCKIIYSNKMLSSLKVKSQ